MTWKNISEYETGNFAILNFTNRNGKDMQIGVIQYPDNTFNAILVDNEMKSSVLLVERHKGTWEEARKWCERYAEKL